MHAMRGDTCSNGSMVVKPDMAKAFDKVEWPFLSTIILKLSFPSEWVDLVMRCVKSASFSFLINDYLSGHTIPSRGIRQGNPISPYLFLFCTEGLSGLISKAVEGTSLRGTWYVHTPRLSLTSFLQMILLFFVRQILCKQTPSSKSYIFMSRPRVRWLTSLRPTWCLAKGFQLNAEIRSHFN